MASIVYQKAALHAAPAREGKPDFVYQFAFDPSGPVPAESLMEMACAVQVAYPNLKDTSVKHSDLLMDFNAGLATFKLFLTAK